MKQFATFSLAVLVALPLLAATPGSGTINSSSQSTAWSGALFAAAANAITTYDGCIGPDNRPLATAVTSGPVACEVYSLTVAVDAAFWADQTGGVTVRIDGYNAATDFDLYVYRRNADGTLGTLADDSAGPAGAAEVAFVEKGSGDY